jgi:Cu/Ag efflux protein CusF
MKLLNIFAASLLALGLTACGGGEETAKAEPETDKAAMDMAAHDGMDHGDHEMGAMGDGVGHATGVIRSVGSQGDFLTIEHGPFDGGIEMGAMTMGFDIMGGVDLSDFTEGDEVAFMVKQGRDGSYRIMAICNTGADGADCLDGMMDH